MCWQWLLMTNYFGLWKQCPVFIKIAVNVRDASVKNSNILPRLRPVSADADAYYSFLATGCFYFNIKSLQFSNLFVKIRDKNSHFQSVNCQYFFQNIPSCLLSKVLLFCLEWWVNWISARWTYSQTERYKFVIVCPPQDCGCWVKLIRYLAAIRGQRPRNQPPGQSRTHLAQGGSSEVLRTDVSEPETAGAPGSWLLNLWSQIQYNKPVYNSLGAVQKETIGNFFVSIQVEDKN